MLGPTSPTPAFKIGERTDDPLAMYLSDIYTITANLAGIPGLSDPVRLHQGGPAHRPATPGRAVRGGEPAAHRPRLRARDRLAPEAAGVILMPSDFAKLNLTLTAADLDQAWQDRMDDANALDAAGRHAAAMAARLYAIEIYLKYRICQRLDLANPLQEAWRFMTSTR